MKKDVAGKIIIHTTSAGTQGIVNAVHASEIITGSLVNAKAVAEYIKSILEGREFADFEQKVNSIKIWRRTFLSLVRVITIYKQLRKEKTWNIYSKQSI